MRCSALIPVAMLALMALPLRAEVTPRTDPVLEMLRAQVIGLDALLPLADPPPPAACGGARGQTRGLLVAAQEWTADPRGHLAGPDNDVALIRNALAARGAEAANLRVLLGPEATHAGLARAASDLLAATGCGDSVILHASGWVFGADMLAPTDDGAPPLAEMSSAPTLADLGAMRLDTTEAQRIARMGPFLMLNAPDPGTAEVLSAAALSDLVTRLRNRGAHVTVVLDTSTAEDMALEARQAQVDPTGLWRARIVPGEGAETPPVLLSTQAGGLAVFYGTASGELTVEMRLPRGDPGARYYGLFSFAFAAALLQADVATPAAISRLITATDPQVEQRRRWTYVFSTTDADHPLVAEETPEAPVQRGIIRIIDPAPTRAAAPLDTARLTLRGQVEAAADTIIVTVNGAVAQSRRDGSFSHDIELTAGVNRIDVLAMTRDNQPVTHSFELFFEGDMQALLGDGTRYALLIANQGYAEGSGISRLATPHGDADALAALLRDRYGFVTEAALPDGSRMDLFLKDATRLQIETALFQIGRVAGARDTVLIFYAGHGVYEQATQGAFWLPVDAQAGMPFTWLPAAAISDAILRIGAGNVLVISDSCYSGALLRGEGGADTVDDADRLRALQRLADRRSRIVIASGGNEPVLDGGGDGHSVFARALLTGLAEMDEDAFTARELFDRYLLPMVVGQAAQEPQYRPIERSGHEGGDVVLARMGRAAD
ncbi:MAG: caspase family protein [Paracoccaceae bacterium]|nr:MAG: caspase family protein [Paracoccaceae bacterium]